MSAKSATSRVCQRERACSSESMPTAHQVLKSELLNKYFVLPPEIRRSTFYYRFGTFSSVLLDVHPNQTKCLQVHERRNSEWMFSAQRFLQWERTTNLCSSVLLHKIDEGRTRKECWHVSSSPCPLPCSAISTTSAPQGQGSKRRS